MKTNFFVAISTLFLVLNSFGNEPKPNLAGRVAHEDGSPVRKATVFVYTAGPKDGKGIICPSCYPDCRKKAQTDTEGRFKIESLDPKLQFRLLVVAAEHEAKFVSKVDPATGPMDIAMKPLSEATLKSKSRIVGLVMDEKGQPVPDAVFSVEGIGRAKSTRWGGNEKDADPIAVSDDRGQFVLRCLEDVSAVHAIVQGPGLAKRWVQLSPGKDHLVRLSEGVTVSGQIVREGKPVKDVVMGLITTERQSGICLHDFEANTDAQGRFTIFNVTPGSSYYLLSWCDQNRTGLCEQKRNNALSLLSGSWWCVTSLAASAEDRALRGRNLSAV